MRIEAEGDGKLGVTGQKFCSTVVRRCCAHGSPLLVWLWFGWKGPGTGGGRDRGRSSRGGLDLDDVPARRLIGAAQRTKHGHGCLIPLPLLSFAFTMEWLCTCVVLLPEEEAILAGELGEMVRL